MLTERNNSVFLHLFLHMPQLDLNITLRSNQLVLQKSNHNLRKQLCTPTFKGQKDFDTSLVRGGRMWASLNA